MEASKVRELILNTRNPLLLKNFPTQWDCFDGTIENWCHKYDKATKQAINFERMPLKNGQTPQWESKRQKKQMTLTEFLKEHSNAQTYWSGLNYKRCFELPEECRIGIDFGCFGFPQAVEDYSFWLSSKGANTPCHYDTYGCNIVVQIYGEKSWLLFPPGTAMTSTRIPYEESSVYCLENFYSPDARNLEKFEKLKSNAYHCLLTPGDVLIVPRHWWHYVEALSNSLSLNYWIPLAIDAEAQLEECIVKYLVENSLQKANEHEMSYLFNPNQLNQIANEEEVLDVLEHLLNSHCRRDANKSDDIITGEHFPYQYQDETTVDEQLKTIKIARQLEPISNNEFLHILKNNSQRFCDKSELSTEIPPVNYIKEILVNSICNPIVVKEIKNIILERFKNK